jgi:hypothetical protein
MDMARAFGLHPASAGASPGLRQSPTLGAPASPGKANTLPSAAGLFVHPDAHGHSGGRSKTLWTITRTAKGQANKTGHSLPRHQEDRLNLPPDITKSHLGRATRSPLGCLWLKRKSSISGTIGLGDTVVLDDLPVGQHTILLTARNAEGLVNTTSVKVTINARIPDTDKGNSVYLPLVRKP